MARGFLTIPISMERLPDDGRGEPLAIVPKPVRRWWELREDFVRFLQRGGFVGVGRAPGRHVAPDRRVRGDLVTVTVKEGTLTLELTEKARAGQRRVSTPCRALRRSRGSQDRRYRYRDFGFNVVYLQLLPHHTRGSEEANRANVEWGCRQSARWLNLLDRRMIGAERDLVASDEISIADYFGASIVTLGEIVRLDFSPYPNVKRWLERMQALQHWNTVHDAFSTWAASLGPSYTAPSPAKHG